MSPKCLKKKEKYEKYIKDYNDFLLRKNIRGLLTKYDFEMLIQEYKIRFETLEKILRHIKKNIDNKGFNVYLILLDNIPLNPFNFINDYCVLLSFKTAERIKNINNLSVRFTIRFEAFIREKISHHKSLYFTRQDITNIVRDENRKFQEKYNKNLFDKSERFISAHIDKKMKIEEIDGKKYYTLQSFVDKENLLTDDFLCLYATPKDENTDTVEEIMNFLNHYEKYNHIRLNDQQKNAIVNSMQNKFYIISGYPGTGKTTILNVILSFIHYKYAHKKTVYCMAPTGLAVKNLISRCKRIKNDKVGTIHRMIYSTFENLLQKIKRGEMFDDETFQPTIPDLIVIDEFSMVDILLFSNIMKWLKEFGCKLILMGDVQQLPPIGPCNTLQTIIKSDIFKNNVSYLNIIMRQKNDTQLLNVIKRLTDKNDSIDPYKDFDDKTIQFKDYKNFIIEDPNKPDSKILDDKELIKLIIENNYKKEDTQFLSAQHSTCCGCDNINKQLQDFYNPIRNEIDKLISNEIEDDNKYRSKGYKFRKNDEILRIKNSYEYETKKLYANGDVARINCWKQVKNETIITIEYQDGEMEKMSIDDLYDNFELNYCKTIHKSQGGQYKNVVLVIGTPNGYMWKTPMNEPRKLLFTALSRAEESCIVIGNFNYFIYAQELEEFKRPTLFLKNNDN